MSLYLSVYLQASKRSYSAWLPRFWNLTSKTPQFCGTSSIFYLGKVKNETSLQNLLQKRKVECKAAGLVPMRCALLPCICLKCCPCTCHANSPWKTWRSDVPKCNIFLIFLILSFLSFLSFLYVLSFLSFLFFLFFFLSFLSFLFYLSIYLSIFLSFYLSIFLSFYLSIYPSLHLSIYPSIYPSLTIIKHIINIIINHIWTVYEPHRNPHE